jgi:hypothetical protein
MGRWHDGKGVWRIVKESARRIGVAKLAPHDLRRYAESRIMLSSTVAKAWTGLKPVRRSGRASLMPHAP